MHKESIYNLLSEPEVTPKKEKMYRSKYDPKAPLTGSTFGLRGTNVALGKGVHEIKKTGIVSSTFGPRARVQHTPSDFLKKKSRPVPKVGGSIKNHSRIHKHNKPPVPSRNDKPIMGLHTTRNFITRNALDVILRSSHTRKNENLNFMAKDGYGTVPEYLARMREAIAKEKQLIEEYVKPIFDRCADPSIACKEMDEEDRKRLIKELKQKWDNVNSEYQKVCHRVQLEGLDARRKDAREAELDQLHKDIIMLSRPGPIMIIET